MLGFSFIFDLIVSLAQAKVEVEIVQLLMSRKYAPVVFVC